MFNIALHRADKVSMSNISCDNCALNGSNVCKVRKYGRHVRIVTKDVFNEVGSTGTEQSIGAKVIEGVVVSILKKKTRESKAKVKRNLVNKVKREKKS